jgi:pimeloyl-ACP methyl ester carboxylesterase
MDTEISYSTPAVIFVHGVRTSSAIWTEQLAHVRAAGHLAVAVDLPGHGSRHLERFSLQRAFDLLDDAAAGFPVGIPVVVVGMSLGGYTALTYAATRPARLAGIVACACSSDPKGKPVALYRDVAAAVSSVATTGRRGLEYLRSSLRLGRSIAGGARTTALTGPTFLDGPGVDPVPGWHVVSDALTQLAGRSTVSIVRSLSVPVWLINGQRDHMRLDEKRYLEANTDAALVVVPGAGHDVNLHAPAAFNRALSRALSDIGRRAVLV